MYLCANTGDLVVQDLMKKQTKNTQTSSSKFVYYIKIASKVFLCRPVTSLPVDTWLVGAVKTFQVTNSQSSKSRSKFCNLKFATFFQRF